MTRDRRFNPYALGAMAIGAIVSQGCAGTNRADDLRPETQINGPRSFADIFDGKYDVVKAKDVPQDATLEVVIPITQDQANQIEQHYNSRCWGIEYMEEGPFPKGLAEDQRTDENRRGFWNRFGRTAANIGLDQLNGIPYVRFLVRDGEALRVLEDEGYLARIDGSKYDGTPADGPQPWDVTSQLARGINLLGPYHLAQGARFLQKEAFEANYALGIVVTILTEILEWPADLIRGVFGLIPGGDKFDDAAFGWAYPDGVSKFYGEMTDESRARRIFAIVKTNAGLGVGIYSLATDGGSSAGGGGGASGEPFVDIDIQPGTQ